MDHRHGRQLQQNVHWTPMEHLSAKIQHASPVNWQVSELYFNKSWAYVAPVRSGRAELARMALCAFVTSRSICTFTARL